VILASYGAMARRSGYAAPAAKGANE
jgi:hypothetical protein